MKKPTIIAHLAHPTHLVASFVHRRIKVNHRVLHILSGVVLVLIGTAVAHGAQHFVGPLLSDAIGYSIHGLGLMPILKLAEDLIG